MEAYPEWIKDVIRHLSKTTRFGIQIIEALAQDKCGVFEVTKGLSVWVFLGQPPPVEYVNEIHPGPTGGGWIKVVKTKWQHGKGYVEAGEPHYISNEQIRIHVHGIKRYEALCHVRQAEQMEMF